MSAVLGTVGPSAAWYLTRSTGAVAMLMLSASVALGVLDVQRFSTPHWPRFVVDSLHRNVSLLVLVFLAAHIVTSAVDSFAPIPLIDSVLPFVGSYRPLWLGLGALSFDLFLAVLITSVMRGRLGHRAWRATHWLGYASWPVALVHGLGTGSDVKSTWMLGLTLACTLAVVVAVAVRATSGWPRDRPLRAGALAAAAALVAGLLLWLPGGPLGRGWAQRSGTPVSLLASTSTVASTAVVSRQAAPVGPFHATLAGTTSEGPGAAAGQVAVRIVAQVIGGVTGRLRLELDGQPSGGGVVMSGSRVSLRTSAEPAIYLGRIVSLAGTRLVARVARGDGRTLSLDVGLVIDSGARTVSGTLSASPVAGAGG